MPDRRRLAWVVPVVTYLIVFAITAIAAAVSYEHEYQLAHRNGQAPWVSSLLPFTVDGLILAASVVILWAATNGIRRPFRPLAVLVVGIGATIAANLASGLGHGAVGAAVAAWCGLALIFISDLAMWVASIQRKLASGENVTSGHPAADCSCPPVPLTLAEWVPLARPRLAELGLPAGEQALADRMQTKRYKIQQAQSGPEAPLDAAVTAPPTPAAAGEPSRSLISASNGSHG